METSTQNRPSVRSFASSFSSSQSFTSHSRLPNCWDSSVCFRFTKEKNTNRVRPNMWLLQVQSAFKRSKTFAMRSSIPITAPWAPTQSWFKTMTLRLKSISIFTENMREVYATLLETLWTRKWTSEQRRTKQKLVFSLRIKTLRMRQRRTTAISWSPSR